MRITHHRPSATTASPSAEADSRPADLPPAVDHRPLRAEDVHIAYGRNIVVSGVSYEFRSCAATAIMGPSGCGKSTFLKALNRTLELTPGARVTSGRIYLSGQDLYHRHQNPAAVRKAIGIIHQRPLPFPMSILENVLFGVRYHKFDTGMPLMEYARHHLERVGLWHEVKDRLKAPAAQLSGGQQQRLCLARALANQCQIILMDEPCSALDPASTRRIEGLIHELKSTVTLIVVTHNMSQARRVSDEALFFYEGRLVESGLTANLFENPANPLTGDFVRGEIG